VAHITHANTRLTPAGRLALARCVVEDGWTLRRAAERFQTNGSTAKRYRALGQAGMVDRPSRPTTTPGAPPPAANAASSNSA